MDKIIQQLLEQTDRTWQHLTPCLLAEQGWMLSDETVPSKPTDAPFIYLYAFDLLTQWCWMCRTPFSSFNEGALMASQHPDSWEVIRNALSRLESLAADGTPPSPLAALNWEEQLALLMSGYAGTTSAWSLADHMEGGGHFVVIHHRTDAHSYGRLRPFIVSMDSPQPLSSSDLWHYVHLVLSIDQQRQASGAPPLPSPHAPSSD